MEKLEKSKEMKPNATEFIPRSRLNPINLLEKPPLISSMNGLNLAAEEWIPPSIVVTSESTSDLAVSIVDSHEDPTSIAEETMVEVTWNGSTFFVPSSMAYEYEGGGDDEIPNTFQSPSDDIIGLDWSNGSSTLPAPPRRSLQTFGIKEPIREHFQRLDIESSRQMQADDERYKELPPRYHSAFLLDDSKSTSGGSFGYPSVIFKVVDRTDSQIYALRRFDNVRSSPAVLKSVTTKWLEIRHPSIVSLYNISQERGAIFFAHAYHPLAQTLKQRYIDQRGALLTEELLWRLLTQLLSGLRLVHSRGMAIRNISVAHVLMTSGTVARFNSPGVTDVLEFESRKSLSELQVDDMVKLGLLVLSLSSRTMVGPKAVEQATLLLRQNYSTDICHVTAGLLSGKAAVTQICNVMAERIQDEFDHALASTDALHSHLRNEYENGRLLRLMLKLGFINERPEYALAPEWSETGDRYMLKLFRDFVFHQTTAEGAPVLDAGHVLSALNKLDTGDPEQIVLCSRDSKDLLVVSYTDVRRCLENAFRDLTQLAESAQSQHSPPREPRQQHTDKGGAQGYFPAAQSQLQASVPQLGRSSSASTLYRGPPVLPMPSTGGFSGPTGTSNHRAGAAGGVGHAYGAQATSTAAGGYAGMRSHSGSSFSSTPIEFVPGSGISGHVQLQRSVYGDHREESSAPVSTASQRKASAPTAATFSPRYGDASTAAPSLYSSATVGTGRDPAVAQKQFAYGQSTARQPPYGTYSQASPFQHPHSKQPPYGGGSTF